MRLIIITTGIVFVASLALPTGGIASGGGYGGGSGARSPSTTDPAYERGKRVARGRAPSVRGFRVCVAASSEEAEEDGKLVAVKLSARSLRPFKRTSAQEVAARLVDCEDVESRAASVLSNRDLSDLVYFLNHRFKLRL